MKEYKKIGTFKCQRAKTFDRNRNYTAWFTSEVPSQAGPWKLHGLPGLILEAESEDGEVKFLFESLTFNPKNEKVTMPKTYGKPLTLDAFVETRKKFFGIQKSLSKADLFPWVAGMNSM